MSKILNIAEIIVSILLIISILLQNRDSGLSSVFGGSGEIYRTKRGLEKFIFISTIILAIIFFAIGIVRLIIKQ